MEINSSWHNLLILRRYIIPYFVLQNCDLSSTSPSSQIRSSPYTGTHNFRKLQCISFSFNDLHSSPNIVRAIKSSRMRWAGHAARMGKGKAYTGFWLGNLRERDNLRDTRLDGRITLRWIFRKWDVGGMDWIQLAQDRDRWSAFVNAVMNLRVP